jgi:hypothetical protein
VSDTPEPQQFASLSDAVAALSRDPGGDGKTPRVRLYVPGAAFSAARYVEAEIKVDEDAYVMVVAVDRDHRVHVVFPESPDQTGFLTPDSSVHAQRFFGGFGSPLSYASYGSLQGGSAGNMVAIASDRPFQFQRLTDADGDWDEYALERIVFNGSPTGTAYSLGQRLTLTGQSFSVDRTNFIGGQFNNAFAFGRQNSCYGELSYDAFARGYESFYSDFGGLGDYASFVNGTPVGTVYTVANGVRYAQTRYMDPCGRLSYGPPTPVGPVVAPPVDTTKHRDSTSVSAARYAPRIATTGTSDGSGSRVGGVRFRSPEEVAGSPRGFTVRSRDGSGAWTGEVRAGDPGARVRAVRDAQSGQAAPRRERTDDRPRREWHAPAPRSDSPPRPQPEQGRAVTPAAPTAPK